MIAMSFIAAAHFGQAVGDLNAGDGRRNRFRLTAVFVPGLGAERFELAGPATHPEQDARHAALPQIFGRQANRVGPTHHAGRRAGCRGNSQEIAPIDDAITIGAGVNVMLDFEIHGNVPGILPQRTQRSQSNCNSNFFSVISVFSWLIALYRRCENSDEFNSAQSKSSNTAERFLVSLQYASAVFSSVSVGSRDSVRR